MSGGRRGTSKSTKIAFSRHCPKAAKKPTHKGLSKMVIRPFAVASETRSQAQLIFQILRHACHPDPAFVLPPFCGYKDKEQSGKELPL